MAHSGQHPYQVPPPPTSETATPATYAQIESELDSFSNALVAVENLIVAPSPPTQLIEGTSTSPTLPQLPGTAGTLLFCIPPNAQLLGYWSTVADRLYKETN